jgi:hypothetical protein
MRNAKPKEGAIGNGRLVIRVDVIPFKGVHGVYLFSEMGSFKLRLGTRSYWGFTLLLLHERCDSVTVFEGSGRTRQRVERNTIIIVARQERRVSAFITTLS